MKIIFDNGLASGPAGPSALPIGVRGETDRLTDLLLSAPLHLEPVPCCSVTRESIRAGFTTSTTRAVAQHDALRALLVREGVVCHTLPAAAGMADMCFTRDIAVTTPWGLVALNPAMPHRAREADHLVAAARRWTNAPVARIDAGTIEGGDVCIARDGLLIVGVSGERTSEAGAEAFAARFRAEGWDVLLCPFDPHFLHLDTIFCMIDPHRALACVEALDDGFLAALATHGIALLPVGYEDARALGCNILSLNSKSVIAGAGTPRVSAMMRAAGIEVHELEIGEMAACGGGVHCMTMPLARG